MAKKEIMVPARRQIDSSRKLYTLEQRAVKASESTLGVILYYQTYCVPRQAARKKGMRLFNSILIANRRSNTVIA